MLPPGSRQRTERLTGVLTLASASLCLATGAAVIAGWRLGSETLVAAHRGYTPMQGNTALAFLLLGISLAALFFARRTAATAGALLVIVLAALTLLEYATGAALAIDHLVPHPVTMDIHSGRMAPNTALALLAAGVSLLLLAWHRRVPRGLAAAAGLSSCVIALGAVPLAGYLLALPNAFRWGVAMAMALPTACLFVAIGVGILAWAWRTSLTHIDRVPRWLPASAFLLCASASLFLAGALLHEAHTQGLGEEARRSLELATVLTLTLGVGTAAGLAAVIALAQRASRRARDLEEVNRRLDHEVEERRQAQAASERLNRALRLVSECDHALAHASDEGDLLQRICELAVGTGGYRLAWIGFAEDDGRKSVRIAAKAGEGSDYLEDGMVSWADEAQGRGPTGTAIRTAQAVGCDYVHSDPNFLPWRERALRHGLRSTLAVPLLHGGRALGALSIYAQEENAFQGAEVDLLVQLTDDLAFGIGAMRNRAARDAAEQQVRKASMYARSLIEASLDPLVTISREGKITDVNRATEAATGLSRERLIGTDFSAYFTEPDRARDGYQRVFAEGLVKDYPLVVQHTSGRVTEVLYNASVYRGESGEIEGVFAAARDITELKRAERRLTEQQFYTRSLIEASLDPLMTVDAGGVITDVNRQMEALTGVERAELVGSSFPQYCTDPVRAEEGVALVFREGKVTDYELTVKTRDGRETVVSYNATTYHDSEGGLAGVFAAARDITDRKRAEAERERYAAELKRSNEELQEFAFVASHDLQEPLRKITAFSERLRDRAGGQLDDVSQDYLARMHNAAERMSRLIESLLDYSRVATRTLPFQEVDLAQVMLGVLADLEQRLRESRAEVTVGILPKVTADPTQLRQLFQNLLANALKFHAPDQPPRVAIRARSCGDRWEISCADQGIGFDLAYADRIFRPFQRLHGRNEYEGSGMGLAICRKIAQRHGANITVHSEPGKGSTFTVSLSDIPESRTFGTGERTSPCPEPRFESCSPKMMMTTTC